MRIMSLDCEYNQPSQKTIEIGAVVYDVRSGNKVESFQTYVNPGEPIYNIDPVNPGDPDNIAKLTGIYDHMVMGAPDIKQAFEELRWFHAKHKCFVNPLVWGSGVRNDSQLLHIESGSELPNFMGYRVIDVKSIFQSIQMMKNEKIRGGLSSTCDRLGIGFEGRPHGALADAVNTFRVWHFLMKRFDLEKK